MRDMNRIIAWLGVIALATALVAGFIAMMAGLGHRWNWWDFPQGFTLLRWALILALAALVVGLVTLGIAAFKRHRTGLASGITAILLALIVAWPPVDGIMKARSLPYIYDITTDTDNPPAFEAVLGLRQQALNPPNYPGAVVADKQRQAYPDIGPLLTGVPADYAFTVAHAVAERMGWELINVDPARGRIEAVDTTFWFGFKDDIVIRVRAEEEGSRIDVRSASRVGRSDLGTNAERIRRYLARLDTMLAQ